MKEFEEYKFIITRRDDDNTRWHVVPSPSNPSRNPVPGSVVMWEFDEDAYYVGLEAHFQFCHFVQDRGPKDANGGKVCHIASEQINKDWAGSIPDHVGSKFLMGTLRRGIPAKKALHYAVWIVDPQGLNDFAIGDNPPPKIDTGGDG